MPYRLISFLIIYKVLLTSLPIRVCFYIGVAIGVIGRTYSVRVLLAVAVVYKVVSKLVYRFYKSIIKTSVLPSRFKTLYVIIEDRKLLIRLAKISIGL